VLVVEDEPEIRRVLDIVLRNMGHETVFASSGEEALEFWTENNSDYLWCHAGARNSRDRE